MAEENLGDQWKNDGLNMQPVKRTLGGQDSAISEIVVVSNSPSSVAQIDVNLNKKEINWTEGNIRPTKC